MARKKQPARQRPTPTPEEIIRAWQTSESVPEACAKLHGMNPSTLSSRVRALRKRGVPLKTMKRGKVPAYTPEKIEELKRLAESLGTEEQRR